MATRKEARRKSLLQILTMLVAVFIIVVSVIVFQNWHSNRGDTPPAELTVTVTINDVKHTIYPYLSCEPGADCPEGEVPNFTVGADDSLTIEVPSEVSKNQWQLLTIYDNPAANDQKLYGAGEATSAVVAGSVDPIDPATDQTRPRLQVVEVSAVLIDKDANGEETPVTTVWSLSTMTDEELAASKTSSTAPTPPRQTDTQTPTS